MISVDVVAQIPVTSSFVPGWMEHLIHKKVAKLALSLLEKIADFILSWIYCPYSSLYAAKLSRIHTFKDGTPFIDCTKDGISSITDNEANGRITMRGGQIYFFVLPNMEVAFSKAHRTEYVTMQEDPRGRQGWFQITEQELRYPDQTKPKEKLWSVNGNEAHRFQEWPHLCFLADAY